MKKDVIAAPKFCQFESGSCTKIKGSLDIQDSFFAYSSKPEHISSQINNGIKLIRDQGTVKVQDWQNLAIDGRIIYCEICKAIRRSKVTCADITTLNDNVLFEIGFAVGLGKNIWPIRDASYEKDTHLFKKIGLFDYIGYTDFRNSQEILSAFLLKEPWVNSGNANQVYHEPEINSASRLLYYKSQHSNDGSIFLSSLLKKTKMPLDIIDPAENLQLSLRDLSKRVSNSLGVLVHMLDPERKDAVIHNAKCTFLAGMALAMEKPVLILQESEIRRPIDYGEIIRTYTQAKNIKIILDNWLPLLEPNYSLSKKSTKVTTPIPNNLEYVDLGELAAENEVEQLKSYFVKTPIYTQIMSATDCVVTGRKGVGKTALFYEIRRNFRNSVKNVVLDLMPEGYQLRLFAEVILVKFPEGAKQYLVKSFWEYILLSEIGRKILQDHTFAYQNAETIRIYKEIEKSINPMGLNWEGDFAQRLMEFVNYIHLKLENFKVDASPSEVTRHLFVNELHVLRNHVAEYLTHKQSVVILIDNLDKDWKPYENIKIEIDLLRSLIDSVKTLSKDLQRKNVSFRSAIFIRNDIYSLLNDRTPDKGKDNIIHVYWPDNEVLKRVVQERFEYTFPKTVKFEDQWYSIFCDSVKGVDSFSYLLDHTLRRPRDLLTFIKMSIETAIGRGHEKVLEEDIIFAGRAFSDKMFNNLADEINDVFGDVETCMLEFLDEEMPLSESVVIEKIQSGSPQSQNAEKPTDVLDKLLEFGFLGIESSPNEFSYNLAADSELQKIKKRAQKYSEREHVEIGYTIHPTFRSSLGISE